jgi:hypothetical protein
MQHVAKKTMLHTYNSKQKTQRKVGVQHEIEETNVVCLEFWTLETHDPPLMPNICTSQKHLS